jgi:chromosomal replication initiation ATPase DnaA
MEKSIAYLPQISTIKKRIKVFEKLLSDEFGYNIKLSADGLDFQIAIDNVAKSVSECLSIPMNMLFKSRGKESVTEARHIACYLCKTRIEDVSYKAIGSYFGDRDHSTIIHSVNTVLNLIDVKDEQILAKLEKCNEYINEKIKQHATPILHKTE